MKTVLLLLLSFVLFYMQEPLRLDYLWVGLCLMGAAYFMFRAPLGAGH